LVVRQALKEPIITERFVAEFNKKVLGKTFGKDAGVIQSVFAELSEQRLLEIQGELAQGPTVVTTPDGRELTLTPEVVTIERKTFKQSSVLTLSDV
jgi:glycyl-tRNA synthetase